MKEKRSKKVSVLPLLLAAIDIALLIWIGKSYITEKNKNVQPAFDNTPVVSVSQETETALSPQNEQTEQQPEQKPETQGFDTDARPTDDDFLEWFAKDVMWNGVPAGVEKITEFSQIVGKWKGLIYHDPNNERDSEAVELLNFTVGGSKDAATLAADWYSIYFVSEGKGYSKEEENDSVFTGLWLDGALEVTGAGNIHLTEFYVLDGKQYAAGTMDCVDGVTARVAMVRP